METARRAKDKGQFDKAIREYLKVVEDDPKDVRVWLKIGDLYAQKGAKGEATETYTKVARFYSDQGFYLKSVAVYKQILKLDPRLVEINLKLAELYRQLGLLSDAMQHFEMVAAFFHREGKTREALATLRQLVELDPENVATRIKLAELYSKEEMVEEAVTEFGHACEFLRAHNRIDDFVKVAERLLWHNQDNLPLNKELATLYLHRGDPRRALQKLQVCFKADGRDVDTLSLLAQAFQALDQRGKTVSVLKELARVLSESGKRTQADEVHRKILSFVPDDADSLEHLGMSQPAADPYEVADDMILEEPEAAVQDFQPRGPGSMGNPTGSFPLIQSQPAPEQLYDPGSSTAFAGEAEFSGLETDFAGDDPSQDFAADFDMADEPSYQSSVRGEANSDEIVKVLTETDVYVKYGLHQKAIEHLHRVFELDPDNIEARERLKDIFLSLGREREAVSQLIHLASVVAPREPARAGEYLRSILAIDSNHADALAIASRFRIDVSGEAEVEIVDEGLDFGDRDAFGFSPSDYGDPAEPVGYASGSPLPSAGNTPVPAASPAPYELGAELSAGNDFSLGEYAGTSTDYAEPPFSYSETTSNPQEIGLDDNSIDYASAYSEHISPPAEQSFGSNAPMTLDESGGGNYDFVLDLDSDPEGFSEPPTATEDDAVSDSTSGIYTLSDDDIILEDEPMGDEGVTMEVSLEDVEAQLELEQAQSTAAGFDDSFQDDLQFESAVAASTSHVLPHEEADVSEVASSVSAELMDSIDSLDATDADEEFGEQNTVSEGARETRLIAQHDDVTMDVPLEELDAAIAAKRQESRETAPPNLEDDLDEADFFISQGLFDEARDILNNAAARHPGHPLILSKLVEVDGTEPPDEIHDPTIAAKPSVLLERPVDDEDADTHFDLGLAYKEMGLFDEAIKAFQKVIHVAGRAVQCHLMLGLCHRQQGDHSEAITQFKAGLYVDQISTAEKYGLYYEIGSSYEQLDDPQEALYYYEMIVKKQPEYRDVAERVAALRERYPAKTGTV